MGVKVRFLTRGDGVTFPKKGQTVIIHYTGKLTDGRKFASTYDCNKPFEFKIGIGNVVKGLDEGVAQMSIGSRAIFTCSPDYAYGILGHPGVIPSNATLIFDVELINLK